MGRCTLTPVLKSPDFSVSLPTFIEPRGTHVVSNALTPPITAHFVTHSP